MNRKQRWSHEDDREADAPNAQDDLHRDSPVALPSLEPLSHSHTLLDPESSEQWDVDSFLLSRSDLPLDELRTELRQYLATLREELGELINDEYEEFLSLGLGLRGESEQLEEIRLPLQVIKVEVEDIRSTFQNAQSSLESLLEERSSLREEKAVLDLLVHLTETLERTENLLGIRRDGQGEDPEEYDELPAVMVDQIDSERTRGRSIDKIQTNGSVPATTQPGTPMRPKLSVRIASSADDIIPSTGGLGKRDIKMLRRIANEYTQLVYLTNKAKREQCEYVTVGAEGADIENRINKLKETLHAHLASSFAEIITSLSEISQLAQQNRPQQTGNQLAEVKGKLMDCLEVYEMIGGWREAEEVLRKFVRRQVSKLITWNALTIGPQQDLAPPTPYTLPTRNAANVLSPDGSIKTPFTPTFVGSVQAGGVDGFAESPVSIRSVPNENANVFEQTLAKPMDRELNGAQSAEGCSSSKSPVYEGTQSATGPQTTYLSETGPGGNLGAIYNALLRYIQSDLQPIIKASNTLRGRQKALRHPNFDFGVTSEIMDSVRTPDPTAEQTDLSRNDELDAESGLDGFEFMSRVIWTEIGARITSEIGTSVFAAGRVSELHQNYTITHEFLSQLESLSDSIYSVALIRSSETYEAFGKRWQLPIYFQLRWKEIVVALEDALSNGIGSAKGTKDGYALPQTSAVVTAVKACWAPSTYIPELGHRFWRLTLQVLSRYRTWLEKAVPALYNSGLPASMPGASTATSSAGQSLTISRSTTPQPTSNTPLPTGDPSSDPSSAIAEDNILKISSMVASDLIRIQKDINNFWSASIVPELSYYLEDTDMAQVDLAMQQSLNALSLMFKPPAIHIQQILIRRCIDPLKLVRSVASQLRATASTSTQKEPEPSHFVGAILKPLREYFAPNGLGDGLKAEVGDAWSRIIISEVVASYTAILVSVRKTEDLLRRHRKGKKTGFSLFGQASANAGPSVEEEEQRFKQQMMADIMALAKEAEKLGISMEAGAEPEIPGWTTLLEVANGKSVDASAP